MELLSAFIPADRQLALACGETLPDQAVGAVLFADLSGFTPFTEAITTALGPQRGAEVITAWLNLIFEALIAEVSAFGGSVITFSGDAITCWFGARPGRQSAPLDMAHAARRAVAAALACQRAIERVNSGPMPAGISAALGLKAAVATGSTRRFVVGDPAFQLIDVLAGSTLDRLAEAEQLARRGEVLIAAEVVADLDASLRISGWRTDEHSGELYAVVEALVEVVAPAPLEPVGPQALREEQARPWLLPAVYERLRSGQSDFLAELRPATALFMRFGGINYDADPQAGARLNAFVRWVQGIVGHYEGFVLQLTMGDKGSYLYAAFGAPIAHAADTARAAAAAQALRQLPSELSFIDRPQIGLSQGVMYCGPYGAATRRTYGVFGDEVNTAARLMQVAQPGQIICTERVASLLRHRAVLHLKGAISVKGKQQPVAIFELGERADHHTVAGTAADDGELFGREQELAQLVDRLRAATERGASAAVLLSGEAGIGKSRLLAATRDAALAAGARVLSGFSDAIERATPYLAWCPVFSELLDLARIEAGHMTVELAPLDLRRLVVETVDTVQGLLRARALSLRSTLPATLPTVVADADRVRQVLLNLLSNAVKFTERGMITVSAATVDEVGEDGRIGRYVVVRVADTGIGIPPERHGDVFEEFVQIHGRRSRVAGTGLGLAIARKLVEAQHGRIWVESNPGAGSTFSFTLPLQGNSVQGTGHRGPEPAAAQLHPSGNRAQGTGDREPEPAAAHLDAHGRIIDTRAYATNGHSPV